MIRVGIPKEIHPGERRVAATPQTVIRLRKLGFEVAIERNDLQGLEILYVGSIELNVGARTVRSRGQTAEFTAVEFDLLTQVVRREEFARGGGFIYTLPGAAQ